VSFLEVRGDPFGRAWLGRCERGRPAVRIPDVQGFVTAEKDDLGVGDERMDSVAEGLHAGSEEKPEP